MFFLFLYAYYQITQADKNERFVFELTDSKQKLVYIFFPHILNVSLYDIQKGTYIVRHFLNGGTPCFLCQSLHKFLFSSTPSHFLRNIPPKCWLIMYIYLCVKSWCQWKLLSEEFFFYKDHETNLWPVSVQLSGKSIFWMELSYEYWLTYINFYHWKHDGTQLVLYS